jgi:hypothetical protein
LFYQTLWVVDTTRGVGEGFIYFALALTAVFVIGFLRAHSIMTILGESLKIRTVITKYVYDKVMKLGNAGLSESGKIVFSFSFFPTHYLFLFHRTI